MTIKKSFDMDKFINSYLEAKPLKVSELYILGILSLKDSSGYDIYKLIAQKSQGVGSWLKLNKATVYNTLTKMKKDDLVELVEIIQDLKKPPKSIYRLTEKGKEHLRKIILDDLNNPPWVFVNFTLPLRFSKVLTKSELLEVIERKIEQVELFIEFNKMTTRKFFSGTILELFQQNYQKIFELELEFLKKLKSEVKKKSINELFRINEFDIDKIMKDMKKISQSEVSK